MGEQRCRGHQVRTNTSRSPSTRCPAACCLLLAGCCTPPTPLPRHTATVPERGQQKSNFCEPASGARPEKRPDDRLIRSARSAQLSFWEAQRREASSRPTGPGGE